MQIVQPKLVGLSTPRLERIRPVMQAYIDWPEFAGIITCIARQGQVAHLEAFGWQEIETDRPMQVDTIFRIKARPRLCAVLPRSKLNSKKEI